MKILVIDTDSSRIHSLKTLEAGGHLVQSFDSWSKAREFLDLASFPILVLGPEQTSVEAVTAVSKWRQSIQNKTAPLVVAMGSEPGVPGAESGIDHFLPTPIGDIDVAVLPSLPSVPAEPEAIDHQAALEICDGDEDLFREIAGIFLREGPRRKDKMTRAFEGKDWKGVGEAAHLMKGSALNLAAGPLRLATKFLEQAAEAGRPQHILFWYPQVRYEYERLSRRLTSLLGGPADPPP